MPTYLQNHIVKYQQLAGELSDLSKTRKLSLSESFMCDRALNILDAARLGLEYAVYSGGIIEGTMRFCKARNKKVFSVDEITLWAQSLDRPQIEDYDPFIHLGGNCCHPDQAHCQHRLLFISNEEAARRQTKS